MEKWIYKVFWIWLVSSAIIFGGVYILWGKDDALSCFAGEILVGFNLLAMIWAWQRIYSGKGLALAVSVIVFKYAILATSIYWLIVHKLVNPFSFLIGSGVLFLVVAVLSYQYKTSIK